MHTIPSLFRPRLLISGSLMVLGDLETESWKVRSQDLRYLEPDGTKYLLRTGLVTRLVIGASQIWLHRGIIHSLVSPALSSYYVP